MRTFIAPYKMGSESARDLARALRVLRISGNKRLKRSVVINWGKQDLTVRGLCQRIINRPEAVRLAANKIETFRNLNRHGISTVDWTQDRNVALGWLDQGDLVYCRGSVTGSQGQGITVIGMDDLYIPNVALYTRGFNKTHEYRVHVAFGQVIDFSKKRKRNEGEHNPYIKNYNNGWVFCRDEVSLPEVVKQISIAAIAALGLDFGALDVLYKERDDEAKVLEINTAPGVEGTSLTRYTEAFTKYINQHFPTPVSRWVGNRYL